LRGRLLPVEHGASLHPARRPRCGRLRWEQRVGKRDQRVERQPDDFNHAPAANVHDAGDNPRLNNP